MQHQPPPTPIFPRFADQSLLLATEPFFGDVTLGDDEEWSVPLAGRSRLKLQKTMERDKTLDLDAYLPCLDEEDDDDAAMLEPQGGLGQGEQTRMHKRDGSESLGHVRETSGPKRRV